MSTAVIFWLFGLIAGLWILVCAVLGTLEKIEADIKELKDKLK